MSKIWQWQKEILLKKDNLLYEIDSKEIESAERQVDLAISQARLSLADE